MTGASMGGSVETATRSGAPVVGNDAQTHRHDSSGTSPYAKEAAVSTQPTAQPTAPKAHKVRHANLYLTRLDPWSVMKVALMLSIALAIVTLVAVAVLWTMLAMSGTISAITRTATDIAGTGAGSVDITGLLSFSRVMGVTAVVAFMEIILFSALATLFAYLYNLAVAFTGGLAVTLTEDH